MHVRLGTLLRCAASICAVGIAISSAQGSSLRDTVRTWRKAHEHAIVADFFTLLSNQTSRPTSSTSRRTRPTSKTS
jgi:hypothetical protein